MLKVNALVYVFNRFCIFLFTIYRVTRCVCWITTLWYWIMHSWYIVQASKCLVENLFVMLWLKNNRQSFGQLFTESLKFYMGKIAIVFFNSLRLIKLLVFKRTNLNVVHCVQYEISYFNLNQRRLLFSKLAYFTFFQFGLIINLSP